MLGHEKVNKPVALSHKVRLIGGV